MVEKVVDLMLLALRDVAVLATSLGILGLIGFRWKTVFRLGVRQFQRMATETNSGTYLMDHINKLDGKLDRLAESHDQHASTVYERFADGSANFERIDQRLDATEQRTSKIEGQLDVLIAAPRAAALAAMDTEDAEVERLIG